MKSAELLLCLQQWLDSGDIEFRLLLDQVPLRLQRRGSKVLLMAVLNSGCRVEGGELEMALRLSGPSRHYFRAALALDVAGADICLVRCLQYGDMAEFVSALEELANQWDVWDAMLQQWRAVPCATSPVLGKLYD